MLLKILGTWLLCYVFQNQTWYDQIECILSVYINGVTSSIGYVLVLLLLFLFKKRLSH